MSREDPYRLFDGPYMTDLSPETRSIPRSPLSSPGTVFVDDGSEDGVRNALGAELRTRRAAARDERIPFLDWALKVPEPKAGKLDFKRFPFQLELYGPEAAADREIVVKKGTQVGVSAWLLRWALYWADMRGLNSLYVFPKLKQMYDFCIAAGERVLMANGTAIPVEDVRVGMRVLSSDGERVVPDVVTDAWCSGVQRVLRVSLAGGRVMRVTGAHRVFTRRGWLRAREVVVGDEVQIPRTLPEPEGSWPSPLLAAGAEMMGWSPPYPDVDITEDDAFLLALWLAEGSKTRAGFTFTNAMPEVRERAFAIAGERGWDVYEAERYTVALTAKWRKSGDTPAAFLRHHGVRDMRTDTVSIPNAVMRAPRAVAEEFWRTYVACDGSVGRREVTVASASERMVRDLQLLAARLGMPATVRSTEPSYPGAKRSWCCAVAEASAREVARAIGVPGKLPAGGTATAEPGELGWAKVRSIEPDGLEETYDLETRDHHAFFLESGLTHNSDARIRAVIMKSPFLQERIPPRSVGNKGLKQVGGGWCYFRGSESEDDLDSVDADVLALDEYDRLTRANIPVAERRITGSKLALLRRVGVPTIPGFGVARLYEETDKRRWMVRCRCGVEQHLTWSDNVDEDRGLRVCRDCRRELTPAVVGAGRWAAEEPDRDVRGYHISKLIVPETDMRGLLDRASRTLPEERQAFWNRDMAEAYAPAEGRLSPQAIAGAQSAGERAGVRMQDAYEGDSLVTMGVDVASTRNLYVRVSEHLGPGRKRALWIGEVSEFDLLDAMMDRYRVHMCAVDHLPEGRLARAFAERFPGRVYLVRYAMTTMQKVMLPDEAARVVSVRRLEAIDATFEAVRAMRNLLPPDLPPDYASHLMAPIRVADQDELGRKKVRYESTGRDDYAHAEVYDLVAAEMFAYRVAVDEATRDHFSLLDEHIDWERSALHHDEDVYVPGPPDEYVAGGTETDGY